MAINQFPTNKVPVIKSWAAGTSGSFDLLETLPAGMYHIEATATDRSTNDIGFVDSLGFTWNATISGGVGFLSLPRSASTIVMPGGSTGWQYPMSVSIYKSTQVQPAALTGTSIAWAADKSYVTGTWATPTTGVTGVRFYWTKNGVTYSSAFSSTTSGTATAAITSAARPVANTSGTSYTLIPYTNNSVQGLPTTGTTGAIPSAEVVETITTSTSWVSPITGTLTQVVVIGGGGYGGSAGYPYVGGGGGAGGYRSSTSIAVTSGNTYTITVGGTSGSSAFGSFASSAGGQGGSGYSTDGAAGGSGGGGGGSGFGYEPIIKKGGAGNIGGYSPVEGYAGGNGSGSAGGQGGSGNAVGIVGGNANHSSVGTGVAFNAGGGTVYYSQGGGGGANNQGDTSLNYGGGGGGARYQGGSTGSGTQGVVFLKYSV